MNSMMRQTERIEACDWIEREQAKHNTRVLIVEDDITSEPIWAAILKRVNENAQMVWATSVNEADCLIRNARVEEYSFDLIISDIFLSGSLTGIDLWLRYHNQIPTPFILISAIDPVKLQKHLKGMDAPIYLQKPLNLRNAIETVYQLLRRPST